MAEILVSVWLYGELARYGGKNNTGSYSTINVKLSEGSTLKDLLDYLLICTNERGVTFINGLLSATTGVQPDLDTLLQNNDRVTILPAQKAAPLHPYSSLPMTAKMSAVLSQPPAQHP